MLESDAAALLKQLGPTIDAEKITALLGRGFMLSLAVETWQSAGIWAVRRGEDDYPESLRRLKQNAPPILYGCGEKILLSRGGLAIVGSRDVDAAGEIFTRNVSRGSGARTNAEIVSGGARGVDQFAMLAALEAGGTVVGALADSLLRSPRRARRAKRFRTDASHSFRRLIPKLDSMLATRCSGTNRFTRWRISASLSVPATTKAAPGRARDRATGETSSHSNLRPHRRQRAEGKSPVGSA